MTDSKVNEKRVSFQRRDKIKKSTKPKMAVLTTVSITINAFYIDQLKALNAAGIKTTVVCAHDPDLRKSLPFPYQIFSQKIRDKIYSFGSH